ncbi:MAG: hypothetical protein VYD19_01505, partial [Myxococcota bacterium]|nr:hypothetical protein [Myxococcota bacterium]
VGLHRYLRQRLGEAYDYDQHIGGYYYFFCRAMIGPAAALQVESGEMPESLGVFFYRPPRVRIEALSRFFAETSKATEQEEEK